ncbi:MAG: LysR family transcriptional regulator [Planctomycetota bacterium]
MQTIRLFVEVARCRSFSNAAKQFGISQSAASQRIGQLEGRLGVKLIDRSVRPFELTQAGELYLVGAVDTLNRFDQMEREVSSLGAGAGAGLSGGGAIRVVAIYSAGIDLLNDLCERFERARPGVLVEIDYHKPEAIYEQVAGQQADLGIVSYPEEGRRLVVHPLRDEVMVVACRSNHALAGRRALAAEELTGREMVGFDLGLPVGKRVQRYLKEQGAEPLVGHRFDNLDTLKNAVTLTDCLAIVPQRCVQRELEAGALCAIRLTPRLVRPVGVVTRRGRDALTPAARMFMDHLVEAAGAENVPAHPPPASPRSGKAASQG